MIAERIIHNDKTGDKSAPVQLNHKFLSNIKEFHTNVDHTGKVTFSFYNIADAKDGFSEEIKLHLSEDEVKILARVIRASKKAAKSKQSS